MHGTVNYSHENGLGGCTGRQSLKFWGGDHKVGSVEQGTVGKPKGNKFENVLTRS